MGYGGIAEFIIRLLEVVAWPFVAIVAMLLFKKAVRELLGRACPQKPDESTADSTDEQGTSQGTK